ncbi:MAG: phosphatase PAP2 family protein [Gammaproteobacteria bacterium]
MPFIIFAVGAVLFEVTDLNLLVNDYFFDFEGQTWRHGQSWWANNLIHKSGLKLVKSVALVAVTVYIVSFFSSALGHYRRAALFAILVMGIGPGLVAIGKQISNMDCPSQIDRYTGDRPHIKLFESKPKEIKRGKCFPGGHSSGAFSLIFIYFLMRESNRLRKYAPFGAILVIGLGYIFSIAQWARGSHFPSHDWSSLFICWFTAWVIYVYPFKKTIFLPRKPLERSPLKENLAIF